MKYPLAALVFLLPLWSFAEEWTPIQDKTKDGTINGRVMETYHHGVKPEWGYAAPQEDTFVVVHPKTDRPQAPLYVVLHSAGHDVFSCVNCTKTVGNHDIYRSPDDYYALYLDCRKNKGDWWWGGMHLKDQALISKNSGPDLKPVEKRVMDTVKWAIEKYQIDHSDNAALNAMEGSLSWSNARRMSILSSRSGPSTGRSPTATSDRENRRPGFL